MRYNTLINKKTKAERNAVEVLLYLSKCATTVKNIPCPLGVELQFVVKATKKAQPIAKEAYRMHSEMLDQLKQAETAADRSSRKRRKCMSTRSK